MTKHELSVVFNRLAMSHKVTRKVLQAIPEDKLDFRATPEMRTVRELVLHMYGSPVGMVEAIPRGELTMADYQAGEDIKHAPDKETMIAYCDACMAQVLKIGEEISEEKLNSIIKCFYGDFPIYEHLGFIYDEHWHHRGQLYVYLRLMGVQPPFLYDFE